MANINSLMSSASSATTNLYGTRNVLSGLASGMDTESMIENSVSGYKTKITQLQQQQTKYEWKQDAYRSITDKLYALNEKYTSYTSKTNLSSNAFFNNAITTTAVGPSDAVSKVSATGRSSSDIQILAAQAATSARYDADAGSLGLKIQGLTTGAVTTSADTIDPIKVGKLNGSMTLNYDGQTVEITFDESDNDINAAGGTSLVDAIKNKLKEVTLNTKNGSMKASEVINVGVENGRITFTENTANNKQGATPYISAIDASLKSALGATSGKLYEGSSVTKYTLSNVTEPLSETQTLAEYLEGRTINVTVDGVKKSFNLKNVTDNSGNVTAASLQAAFQKGLTEISSNVKVELSGDRLKFSTTNDTSNVSIVAADDAANKLLGFGVGLGNYLNTEASIKDLLGSKFSFVPPDGAAATNAAKKPDSVLATSLEREGSSDFYTNSTTGDRYKKVDDAYYRVNEKGEYLYELKINDKSIYVSENASLDSVLSGINNSDMGVTASYSKLTGKLVLTAKETGENSKVEFGGGLAEKLFTNGTKANQNERTLGEIFGLDANEQVTLSLKSISSGANYKIVTPGGGVATTFSATSTLQDVMNAINAKPANGNTDNHISPTISYDSTTGAFSATGLGISNWTITAQKADGTRTARAGTDVFRNYQETGTVIKGTDAEVRAMVNGEAISLTRSSNAIEMDGMTVNLKGAIGKMSEYERKKDDAGNFLETVDEYKQRISQLDETNKSNAVSFTTSGGSDDMMKTIREFVDEYNAAMKQVYDAFATQPAEKSSSTHAKYEPLTDDDKSTMSESAIKSYEEKAKQGILFGDSDLRGLYQSMLNAISPNGSDGATLRDIGIETTYSGGLTQIKLNESKLAAALESDPDKVRNAFTKSKEYGASSDGLMSSIKKTMEQYASTSIATPGILVKKAGSTFSSTSLLSNAMQTQMDDVQTQIERWQTKMSSKIDYYTRQFTALEKLMNTMNSQSSALSGLMGGY